MNPSNFNPPPRTAKLLSAARLRSAAMDPTLTNEKRIDAVNKANAAGLAVPGGVLAGLRKRAWPEEALAKAEAGEYIPPSFAERWADRQRQKVIPDLVDTLRWTVEEILFADDIDRAAALKQTFREFTAAALEEKGFVTKAGSGNLQKIVTSPEALGGTLGAPSVMGGLQ